MFFYLSKTLVFFTRPSNVLFALALLGLVLLLTRYARAGRRLLAGSIIVMLILGVSPLGRAMVLPLENRFPPWDPSRGAPDGIVVLGGAVHPDISAARNVVALGDSAERMTVIAELARRYPDARIVFTGGSAGIFGGAREADYVVRLWESFGIPRERIIVERDSRTTAENAALTKKLVAPKPGERWLLVTSSYHMPRAVGVFRKAGFPVEPYPVDWLSDGEGVRWSAPYSIAGGLASIDYASHEWVGLFAYWLSGRTSALFPAPEPSR